MQNDFVRIRDRSYSWSQRPTDYREQAPWDRIILSALEEMKRMSPEMITKALEVEWPDGMSAQDQIQAMFSAVIDGLIDSARTQTPDAKTVMLGD